MVDISEEDAPTKKNSSPERDEFFKVEDDRPTKRQSSRGLILYRAAALPAQRRPGLENA